MLGGISFWLGLFVLATPPPTKAKMYLVETMPEKTRATHHTKHALPENGQDYSDDSAAWIQSSTKYGEATTTTTTWTESGATHMKLVAGKTCKEKVDCLLNGACERENTLWCECTCINDQCYREYKKEITTTTPKIIYQTEPNPQPGSYVESSSSPPAKSCSKRVDCLLNGICESGAGWCNCQCEDGVCVNKADESGESGGYGTTKSGYDTTAATGYETTTAGYDTTTVGYDAKSDGYDTTTAGYDTTTAGYDTTTVGYDTTTAGYDTTTAGYDTTTAGYDSTTAGYDTTTVGYDAKSDGYDTTTAGYDTTTAGYDTTTAGYETTTAGYNTSTAGNDNTTVGYDTTTTTTLSSTAYQSVDSTTTTAAPAAYPTSPSTEKA